MATDRLSLYNIALRHCRERRLKKLTEDIEPRYLLDEVWDAGDGAAAYCLEQGRWRFAKRVVKLDNDTNISNQFGFNYTFTKPSDYRGLISISADEYFEIPLNRYEIEGGNFFADVDPIYLIYVSDDASYGGDLSTWPMSFVQWVGLWLATQIAPTLTTDIDLEHLMDKEQTAYKRARSRDAVQDPARFPPLSSWANARYGNRNGRRDRGSRATLTG